MLIKFYNIFASVCRWLWGFTMPHIGWAIVKRLADTLEKLGVAGLAITFFGENTGNYWLPAILIILSITESALEARYKEG